MQQLRTHISWIRSIRHLGLSASLILLLFLFALVNASLFSLAQKPVDAQAQDVPVVAKTAETTKAAVAEQPAQATPTPAPTAAPTPAPKPAAIAPKPVPAYDKVSIPSVGFSSKYVTVGLTNTNAIDVNPTLVGWWNGSAQPGTPGATFLDGHSPGVFNKLANVSEGMQITLTKVSGEVFNYTIVHIETVPLEGINMRKALTPYNGASEGLNLMTCAGTYSANTGTTDQRLVVYAIRS